MMADAGREESGEAALTARWLHEQGFHVVPCHSPAEEPPEWFVRERCGGDIEEARSAWPKTPCIKWKEFQTRQPTDAEFDRWESSFPGCNWALITGQDSGIVALDGDDPECVAFLRSGEITRAVWVVETSRGEHHLYRANPAVPWVTGSGKTAKLDVRGNGGYIIAPGSVHRSGKRYALKIADGFSDDPAELTMLTAEDQSLVHQFNGMAPRPSGNLNFDARSVAPAKPLEPAAQGSRNDTLARYAGSLFAKGYSLETTTRLAREFNQQQKPPLADGEVITTVQSVMRTHNANHPDKLVPLKDPEPGADPSAEAAKRLPELKTIEISEFEFMPVEPIEFAWANWIPKGYATGCFAEGGTGKSQLFLQLAVCKAAQIPFLDGVVPPPGKTLLLFCEDDVRVVNNRLKKVMQSYGLTFADVKDKIHVLCRVGQDNYLMTFDNKDVGTLTPFWHQIRALIAKIGFDLFVVDTRGDVFAGSEINNSQARQFVQRALTSLAQEFNLATVFLAHVSVQGKASGSGLSGGNAWRDTARAQIYMHRETPQSQKITIDLMKANHSASGTEVEAWIDGGFLMPAAQIDLATKAEEQARSDFLALLERQRGQEQFYSFDKRSTNYAPGEFSRISNQLKKWKTTKVSDFEAAMEQLLDMDVITRWSDQYGKTKHRVWRKDWDSKEA
jgi:hypothetical protein